MNDDFMQKLMSFLQIRQGGQLVPMSKGGFPMGGANDYLQPPRPPMTEQMPQAPGVDLMTLIRMLGSQQGGGSEMTRMAPMLMKGGVNGGMVPNQDAMEYPNRLNPPAVGVRG